MDDAYFLEEQLENLQLLLQSQELDNALLALQLIQAAPKIPDKLCSMLLGFYSYYLTYGTSTLPTTTLIKTSKKLLQKNIHKKERHFLQAAKSLFKEGKPEAYLDLLSESKFDLLIITEMWYHFTEGVLGERFLRMYTRVITQLPASLRQEKSQAYWAPRIKGSSAIVKPSDGLLLEDLMQWKAIDTLILDPHTAVYNLVFKRLQSVQKIVIKGDADNYERNTLIRLQTGFETLENLQQLHFLKINSISKMAWRLLKPLPKLRKIVIHLDEDPDFNRPCYQTKGFYFFTLVQLEELHLSGRDLNLDIALYKLPNLKRLHIQQSTLEQMGSFFEQLDALEQLESVHFHPALQNAYEVHLAKK